MKATRPIAVVPTAATNDNIVVAYVRSLQQPPLFSDDECDDVIAWAEGMRFVDRKYLRTSAAAARNPDVEHGKQISIDPLTADEHIAWFARKVAEIIVDLNRKIWRFDLNRLSEIGILRYDKGDRFPRHSDLQAPYCDRKIGVFIQLSPPETYQGGVLEYGVDPPHRAPRGRGAVLAFPAWVPHRVTPIRSGTRYSAARFALGPSFR
jgi:predicted 2-oxoglutarate/Fe(II)-dependent dioxygenase YbiX